MDGRRRQQTTKRIGVSATRKSPWRGPETLMAAGYGIITDADNMVTTVTIRSKFSSLLERFYGQREHITDTARSLDDAGRTGIDLDFAPQPQDLDIDAPIENIFVNPGGLQQLLARQRPLRRFEKGQQQGILAFAQRDRRRVGIDQSAAAPFELPAAEPVPPRSGSWVRATRPISCRRNTARTRASNSLRLNGFTI